MDACTAIRAGLAARGVGEGVQAVRASGRAAHTAIDLHHGSQRTTKQHINTTLHGQQRRLVMSSSQMIKEQAGM